MADPRDGRASIRESMGYILERLDDYPRVRRISQYTSQRFLHLSHRWENTRAREFFESEIVPYTKDQPLATTVLLFSGIPLVVTVCAVLVIFGSIAFGFALLQSAVAGFWVVILLLTAAIPLTILTVMLIICYRAYLYYRSLVTSVVDNFHTLYHYYAALYLPKIVRDVTGL